MNKITTFGRSSSGNRKYHERLLPHLKALSAENRFKESHIRCCSSGTAAFLPVSAKRHTLSSATTAHFHSTTRCGPFRQPSGSSLKKLIGALDIHGTNRQLKFQASSKAAQKFAKTYISPLFWQCRHPQHSC